MKISKLSTFIPAFLSEKPIYAGLSTTILFPAELFLTNTTTFIKSLEIDFGDKIKRNFVFGETHNITFESAGKKTIRIVAKLLNGTEKSILTYLEVIDANSFRDIPPVPPCFAQALGTSGAPISATILFTPYEPEPFSNVPGRLEAGYYYANGTDCNGQQKNLKKPILILDGFDPGDERGIGKIYGEKLAYNITNNFGDSLRRQGYDVIIVNFPTYLVGTIPFTTPWGNTFNFPVYRDGGADYIERNAMAVVQLIQNINIGLFLNGSTEQLVVVGASMGGLISRYALSYMEKQALLNPSDPWMNHNTRLWVSFDSPHNGATIPIGSQKMLQKVGDVASSAKETLDSQLGSVAAKQMLLMHYTSPVDKENGFRNIFKSNLTSNGLAGSDGFPKNLRKIALINGQLQGIEKYAGTTGDYMNIKLKKGVWVTLLGFLFPFLQLTPAAELFTYFAPANNNVGVVHTTQLTFLGFIGLQGGSTNAYAYDTNGSIDKAPGGYYNSSQIILNGFKEKGIDGVAEISGNVSYPNLCFIPSKSALAYKGINPNLYENLSGTNLICSAETPFDNYFVPNQDEEHVSISAASATWLFAELNGVPQYVAPVTPPANFNINITADLDNTDCLKAHNVYFIDLNSLPVVSADVVSIKWTVTGDWVIVSADDVTRVSIKCLNNSIGTLRVEVITRNKCLIKGVGTKQVQIIPPADYILNIVPENSGIACVGNTDFYSVGSIIGLPANTSTLINAVWSTSSNLQIIPTNNGDIQVQAITSGASTISVVFINSHPCFGSVRGSGTLSFWVGVPPRPPKRAGFDSCFNLGYLLPIPNGATASIDGGLFIPPPVYLPAGSFSVVLSNSCGVTPAYMVYVTDGMSCKTVGETPKKSDVLPEISVFPNPASTYLDIANILAGSEVKIYTKMGVLVHSEKSENDKIRLDVSKLNTNLYILEAVLPNKMIVRRQIIKE